MNNHEKITEDDEDDDKPEKSKKSKKFLAFFSKFIKSEREQEDKETVEDEDGKVSYLDLLKSFVARDQRGETGNIDIDDQNNEDSEDDDFSLENIKVYVDEKLDETTDELAEGNLAEDEYYRLYENYLVLESINKNIEDKDDIDVSEIVKSVEETLDKDTLIKDSEDFHEEATSPSEIKKPSEKVKKYVFELLSKDTPASTADKIESSETQSQNQDNNQNKVENIQSVTVKPEEDTFDSGPDQIRHERKVANIPELKTSSSHNEPFKRPHIIENKEISSPVPRSPETVHNPPFVESHHAPRKERVEIDPPKPSRANTQPHYNKPAHETVSKKIERSEPERNSSQFAEQIHEDPSYGKLLQEAGRVLIDGVSLRKIFENSDLKQSDLRDLLEAKHDKKKFKKLLAKSLRRRHNDYESIRERISGFNPPHSSISGHPEISSGSHSTPAISSNNDHVTTSSSSSSAKDAKAKSNVKRLNHPFITIMVLILLLVCLLLLKRYLF